MGRMIDADALIAQMEADAEQMEDQIAMMFTYAAINDVKHAPTIEPERTGKWIRHPEQRNIYGGKTIECSECQTKYVVQYIEDERYCRNCGARMES